MNNIGRQAHGEKGYVDITQITKCNKIRRGTLHLLKSL